MTPEEIQAARALASEPPADGDLERKARAALTLGLAEHLYLAVMQETRDEWPHFAALPEVARRNWLHDADRALNTLVPAVVRLIEEERAELAVRESPELAVGQIHELAAALTVPRCETCQGRNRATTDMVCMACGRDYMPDDGSDETGPGLGWKRLMGLWRQYAKQTETERDEARAEGAHWKHVNEAEIELSRDRWRDLVATRAALAASEAAVVEARKAALLEAADEFTVQGMRGSAILLRARADAQGSTPPPAAEDS